MASPNNRSSPSPMKKSVSFLICFILSLTLFCAATFQQTQIPYLDKKSDAYFADTITKAGTGYAACRLINASVSVIKESQIQLEPAGLGVSIAAGQALDPLDDMTERTSNVLATVIMSLGIQKITYELCTAFTPVLLGSLFLFLSFSYLSNNHRAKSLRALLIKALIILSVARLCLPISALTCDYLTQHYFAEQIEAEHTKLQFNSPEINALKEMNLPEADGVMNNLKVGFSFVGEKGAQLKAALEHMTANMGSSINSLLTLSYLYLSLFVLQVIILPIGSFWLMTRLANSLFETKTHYILNQQELQRQLESHNKLATNPVP